MSGGCFPESSLGEKLEVAAQFPCHGSLFTGPELPRRFGDGPLDGVVEEVAGS